MTHLAGCTIEYQYDGGDGYRLSFTEEHATWLVLTGRLAGSTGVENAFTREIAPDVHFITWLEKTGEIVTLGANFASREITCSYTEAGEQHMWTGKIKKVERSSLPLD